MDPLRLISEAAARLAAGGLVAFPTETVYGLGADAFNAEAVALVFEAKGRPSTNPLIVHVTGAEMAVRVVDEWTTTAQRLADAFWPGPLTIVLPKHASVPSGVTAGGETVAVRAPDHPVAMALLESFGGPIVGPSANPSGYVSPTRADHVRAHFREEQVLVLDGGPCRTGIESTVVSLGSGSESEKPEPRVLRRGAIGAAEIGRVLGVPVSDATGPADPCERTHGPVLSPGLLGPHYQPRARVLLCSDAHMIADLAANVEGHAFVLSSPGIPLAVSPPHVAYTMPADPSAYASELYSALIRADESGASEVIVVYPQAVNHAIWDAVRDRLSRASG